MRIYFKTLTHKPTLEEIPRGCWAEYSFVKLPEDIPGVLGMWFVCSAIVQFYGKGSGWVDRKTDQTFQDAVA